MFQNVLRRQNLVDEMNIMMVVVVVVAMSLFDCLPSAGHLFPAPATTMSIPPGVVISSARSDSQNSC